MTYRKEVNLLSTSFACTCRCVFILIQDSALHSDLKQSKIRCASSVCATKTSSNSTKVSVRFVQEKCELELDANLKQSLDLGRSRAAVLSSALCGAMVSER